MNRRILTLGLFALVISLGVTWMAWRMMRNQIASRPAKTQLGRVVAAAHDVQVGTVLRGDDLQLIDWPGTPPKEMFTKKETLIGRGVVSSLYEGEPVVDARLAKPGSGGGLAATIPTGMRACAVKVNEVVGVAGFVTPGMRVDVLVAGNPPGVAGQANTEGPHVKTLLQNIEVLSAGTDIQKDQGGKPLQVEVVNLLVTPEQAEVLSLATNETRVQLVLRNPLDTEIVKTPGTMLASLFGGEKLPQAERPRPVVASAPRPRPVEEKPTRPAHVIDVLNGTKRTEVKFDSTEEPR